MQTFERDSRVIVDVGNLASSNNKTIIRILHVDHDPTILEISKLILMDMGNFEIDHACCVGEAFKKIATGQYDAVISDYEMPQKNGLQFLTELRKQNNNIPFILFTGKGREEIAIEALNLGADGYYNKQGNPETVYGELSHGIHKATELIKAKKYASESEDKFRKSFETSPVAISVFNLKRRILVDCNPSFEKLFGYSRREIVGKNSINIWKHPDEQAKRIAQLLKERYIEMKGVEATTKTGEIRLVDAYFTLFDVGGEPHSISNIVDLTERKKTKKVS